MVDVNLNGIFHCCSAIVSLIIRSDRSNCGRVVSIASVAGNEDHPDASACCTSRAGVIPLTISLGKEPAQSNVAVNCITSEASTARLFEQMTKEQIDYKPARIPRGQFGEVQEIVSKVAWRVSDGRSCATAGVFDFSGGRATTY